MAKTDNVSKIVDISDIFVSSAWNARSGDWTKVVDPETGEGWEQFLASVKENGVRTPVALRKNDSGSKQPYALVAGFRRIMAATTVGLKTVPAIVHADLDTEGEARLWNIAENTAREDLKPADLAWALREAIKANPQYTQQVLANKSGLSQGYISKLSKIMSDVSPKITKQWRESTVEVTVGEMGTLALVPRERQEEEWQKILTKNQPLNEAGEKEKAPWMKGCLKRAHGYGFQVGRSAALGVFGTPDEAEDFARNKEALDLAVVHIIEIKASATKGQKNKVAKELAKGIGEGLVLPPEEKEEETE